MSFSSLLDRTLIGTVRVACATICAAGAAMSWPFRVAENRRLQSALTALSDESLQDMGLNRGDIAYALTLPATRDTGRFLTVRRDERRHLQQHSAAGQRAGE